MTRPLRVLAASLAVAGVAAGVIGFVVHARSSSDSEAAPFTLGPASAAAPPFATFYETRVELDHRCRRVLLANTPRQRVQGLRAVTDLGRYGGMLFAFAADVESRFTMAQTPMPLDIVWYDAQGRPVDRTTMRPCPNGTDASCPAYASKARYRYALETRAGESAAGSLGSCS
ncbi:MAG TPA: DUF192 domain-containing protein [Acidimicrobiia bacterium]|nr:DUF192 domain-containing protein [Acidimicrobiia bacterium]